MSTQKPIVSIPERIHLQAVATPEKTAIVAGDKRVSYGQLDALSDRVAWALTKYSYAKETIIGLFFEQTEWVIVVELGIQKAGLACLPLSKNYPDERIRYCIKNAASPLLITDEAKGFVGEGFQTVTLQELLDQAEPVALEHPRAKDLLTCFYTSGSTGFPKGVLLEQGNLLYKVEALTSTPYAEILRQDKILTASRFSFLLFFTESFVALCNGKTFYIPSMKELKDTGLLLDLIQREKINALCSTPSLVETLLANPKAKEAFHSLRVLTLAGEFFSPAFVKALQEKALPLSLFNAYGATETCSFCIATRLQADIQENLIGRPMEGTEVRIVDSEGHILPEGERGKLLIHSPCLFREYLHLASENARVFTEIEGKRFFDTGDIAALTEEGELEFFGRSDDMVKYHGQRIELKEIEKIAQRFSGIKSCFAHLKDSSLRLLFTAEHKVVLSELSAHLHSYLPDYMVPSVLYQLESMPTNAHGKMDRVALKAMELVTEGEAPQTEIEKALCAQIAELLGYSSVSVTAPLFSLGLSSLSAMRFCAELPQAFCLSMADIKESTSIRDLANEIEKAQRDKIAPKYEKRALYPLMENQATLYLEWSKNPSSLNYNIPFSIAFPGLSASRVEAALRKVIAKHPCLTARLLLQAAVPTFQACESNGEESVVITRQSVEHAPEQSSLQSLVRPFDLSTEALARFVLYEYPTGCTLFADIHHIIFDGFSLSLFTRDLTRLLEGKEIPDESMTLFEYSLAEQEQPIDQARAYFASLAQDASVFSLPTTSQPDGCPCGQTEAVLPLGKIRAFCTQHSLSLSAYIHAGLSLIAYRLSRDPHPLFLMTQNGRSYSSLAHSIGMFVKVMPFIVREHPDRVLDLIRSVERQIEENKRYTFYPYASFRKDSGLQAEFFFVYHGELFQEMQRARVQRLLPQETPVFPIVLEANEQEDSLHFCLSYNGKRYSKETMEALLAALLHLLDTMYAEEQLAKLSLVEESPQLLSLCRGPKLDYDCSQTWVDLFLAQRNATPNNLAVADESSAMSYAELDRISNTVAAFLTKQGVSEGDFVAVALKRRKEFLAVVLGIHKVGAAYVPLALDLPEEREIFILKDSGAKLVITEERLNEAISGQEACALLTKAKPEGKAYMIYTSGTTGRPKGVVVQHKALLNFIQATVSLCSLSEKSRIASCITFAFDGSIMSLLPVLTVGGSLHIAPEEALKDSIICKRFFKKQLVNGTSSTTALGQILGAEEELDLDYLGLGGEALKIIPHVRGKLLNVYGPTEFTVAATSFEVSKRTEYESIPIGRPLANCDAFIVDTANQILPPGLPGELCLAGPQMAEGYWNLPEKTAQVFASIMLGKESYPVYHTGDFAVWNRDGQLEYLGRIDSQVKVRGYRIELGEIESWASKFEGILLVAAIVKHENLSLFFTATQTIERAQLQAFLQERLPLYMVPAFFHQLDSMPQTLNGKIDKRALASLDIQRERNCIAPSTGHEKILFGILAEILGHTNFGITDNLISLGMTSLDAMRLSVELFRKEHTTLLTSTILQKPTIHSLAAFLEEEAQATGLCSQPVRPYYPLMTNQLALFVEWEKHPHSTQYNISSAAYYKAVSGKALLAAVTKVVNAHPFLKARLVKTSKGVVLQRCDEEAPVVSLHVLEKDISPAFFQSKVHPFDLCKERLYRLTVYETPSGSWLFQDIHHIIFDGISGLVFRREIDQALRGEAIQPEAITAYDLSLYEEEKLLHSKKYSEAERYFDELVQGVSSLLPLQDTESNDSVAVASYTKSFPLLKTKKFCSEHGFTLNSFFHAVFAALVQRVSRNDSFVYFTVNSGRSEYPSLHRSVGHFVKSIPVVFKDEQHASWEQSPASFVATVQKQLQQSYSYDFYPYTRIRERNNVATNIAFICQDDLYERSKGIVYFQPDMVKYPVSFEVSFSQEEYSISIEYDGMRYNKEDAQGFLIAYDHFAEHLCSCQKMKDISMLSLEEEAAILALSQGEKQSYNADETWLDMFLRQVEKTPDNLALADKDSALSYRELERQSNLVAARLLERGVGTQDFVALQMSRTKEFMIAVIALHRIAALYIPLSPDYPEERIRFILQNSSAVLTIDDQLIQELLSGENQASINMAVPQDPAYMIYTSGTTGLPKGVLVQHRGLVNLIHFLRRRFSLSEKSRVSSAITFAFDACIVDLYAVLTVGGSLHIAPEEALKDIAYSRRFFQEHGITIANYPTSLGQLLGAGEELDLDCFSLGGEAMTSIPHVRGKVFNMYGPTEFTVTATSFEVDKTASSTKVPIGRPLDNCYSFVVDPTGKLLPKGYVGELCLAGPQLSVGYWKRPEKNITAFKYLSCMNGLRFHVYCTGDLVYWNEDGNLDFVGREDFLVKLHGFRIELGEIESCAAQFPGVQLVVATIYKENICLYYTQKSKVEKSELLDFMAARLAKYMLPQYLILMEHMPVTVNGKIDRKKLPEPKRESTGQRKPANEKEALLCRLFQEVLTLDEVFADENFFEIGGTSISAVRLVVECNKAGLPLVYKNLFENPTPQRLAAFASNPLLTGEKAVAVESPDFATDALKGNVMENLSFLKESIPLGTVLLTGAIGFLGMHILHELLQSSENSLLCVVRSKGGESAEDRFSRVLHYYFPSLDKSPRIQVIDCDLNDEQLVEKLHAYSFQSIVNCAANVKHFAAGNELFHDNYETVKNLIALAQKTGARLIHCSTISIAGESKEAEYTLHECDLNLGQTIENKYAYSKYLAEREILHAISKKKIRGKIMRLGNLMPRSTDELFQINARSNAFIQRLEGISKIQGFPVEKSYSLVEFSQIDAVAKAILHLATTPDLFTVFHPCNSNRVQFGTIILAMKHIGIPIAFLPEALFQQKLDQALKEHADLSSFVSLIYTANNPQKRSKELHPVPYGTSFTDAALYSLGFSWSLISNDYIEAMLRQLIKQGFFSKD